MSDDKLTEEGQNSVDSNENLSEKELARRKLLKRAVLGTGVVASAPLWLGPVVNTVILPAHAQASSSSTTSTSTTYTLGPPVSSLPG
jgi:hypothetical protein